MSDADPITRLNAALEGRYRSTPDRAVQRADTSPAACKAVGGGPRLAPRLDHREYAARGSWAQRSRVGATVIE